MKRGVVVALAAGAFLPASASAGSTFEVHLSVNPTTVEAGKAVRIVLRSFSIVQGRRILADAPGRRLRVEAVPQSGGRVVHITLRHASRGIWRGTFSFPTRGTWRVRLANWPKNSGQAPHLSVKVIPAGATPPPAGFAALGQTGCSPPSPRNQRGDELARTEVFGTTLGGRFWGLFAFMPVSNAWASDDAAVFQTASSGALDSSSVRRGAGASTPKPQRSPATSGSSSARSGAVDQRGSDPRVWRLGLRHV